jgi:hypothetical protein
MFSKQNNLDQLLSILTEKYALRVFNAVWLSQREPFFIRCFFVLQGYVLILFFLLVLLPIIFITRSLYGVMASHTIPSGATHVPTFYSPAHDSGVSIFQIIYPIFGAVFGGLHCIGWTLTFPTEAEKKIWELGSMTITVFPVLYWLVPLSRRLSAPLPATWDLRPIRIVIRGIAGLVVITSIALCWVYLLARISLLIEALELLRKQPASAFLNVDWTFLPPHIKF